MPTKQTIPEVSKELKNINNQFIKIIEKIEVPEVFNESNLLNALLFEIGDLLIKFQQSGEKLQDFIKKNETFQKLLDRHLSVFDAEEDGLLELKNEILKRVNEYTPFAKNTDFIVTIALLEVIKKYKDKDFIKGKEFVKPEATGFSVYNDDDNSADNMSDYTIEMLNSEELAGGLPMVLGGITPCCLNLGATGGNFSLYSIFSPSSNFVVVKHNGKIISHALVWLSEDGETLVIDSIDPTQQLYKELNNGLVDSGLLVYLYNDFAEKFLAVNLQIKNVNMSMGGNTMNAIPSFKKKIFGPFKKKESFDEKQYYSVSNASTTKCGALIFRNDKFGSIDSSALPIPEYWIEIDSSKPLVSSVMTSHSISNSDNIKLEQLEVGTNKSKTVATTPNKPKQKIVATTLSKPKQEFFEKESFKAEQQLHFITTIEEIVKHSGWTGLVKPSLPKSGSNFCMEDFSTHKSTYLHQVQMIND